MCNVVPLTILPAVLGGGQLDWRLVVLFGANMASTAFAFMINEVEDAEDDKRDKKRKLTNPVALGMMSERLGWWTSLAVGVASMGLYALLGGWVYLVGVVNFWLALGYSWRKVRFKSKPVVDLVSHGLTLGGLQYMAGFGVYGGAWSLMVLVFMVVAIVSMAGQLYNQIRDFEADRVACLNNSVRIMGLSWAARLRWVLLLVVGLVGVVVLWQRVVPWYVMGLFGGLLVVFKVSGFSGVASSREKEKEMRSQRALVSMAVAANVVVVVWFVTQGGVNREIVMGMARGGVGMVGWVVDKASLVTQVARWI